jgi:hypothetical protein
MIHFTVPPGQVNRATVHSTVSEFWHVLSGRGEIWRRDESGEEVTVLTPGVSIDIPSVLPSSTAAPGRKRFGFCASLCRLGRATRRLPISKVRGCRQRQSARCLPRPHSEAALRGALAGHIGEQTRHR